MNAFRNFSDKVALDGGLARAIAGGDIALFAANAAGCSGINTRMPVFTPGFIVPGLHIRNCLTPLLISIQTNAVPLSAQASHDLLSMQSQPDR